MSRFKVATDQFQLKIHDPSSLPVDYTALKNDMLNIVYFNKIKYTTMSMSHCQGTFKFAFPKVILKITLTHTHTTMSVCGLEIFLKNFSYSC